MIKPSDKVLISWFILLSTFGSVNLEYASANNRRTSTEQSTETVTTSVGWSNPITWGDADDAEETIYDVVTQRFDLQPNRSNRLPLKVSAGVGTGSFRSKGAIAAGDNPPNFFGSVGLRVIPEMSVVSSWTGSALNLGISAAPFDFPLILSAGASDLIDNTREGTCFSTSIGYGAKF